MRLLAPAGTSAGSGGGIPGVRPSDITFASNQVRIRLPRDPKAAWSLTLAIVARLSIGEGASAPEEIIGARR
jgi:hypothetical protein